MEATVIVTVLALLQFTLFGFQVGGMRTKHGIRAPATTGHPEFERMFRVQMNTLEQLVVFVPALWMHAWLTGQVLVGAGIGLAYIVGRFMYRAAYLKDPAGRGPGFGLTVVATAVLLLWSLVIAVKALI